MYLVTTNKQRNLILLTLAGEVRAPDMRTAREEIQGVLRSLDGGVTFITDFTSLERMADDAAPEIGQVMESLECQAAALVIRVLPDPTKDIGMNILSRFHYERPPRTMTCQSMAEALRALEP